MTPDKRAGFFIKYSEDAENFILIRINNVSQPRETFLR